MKKQSAPSAVVQFAAARSSIEPLDGTTYDAIAEIMKKMQPTRFTAAILHDRSCLAGCSSRGPVATR